MTVPVVAAQPLVDAIEAAVEAQNLTIGIGEKPAVTAGLPYVVAWPTPGTVENKSLLSRDGWSMVCVFQVYGFDPDSVNGAVVKLRAAIFGLAFATVGGRSVMVPSHAEPPPMARDDDADPPLWWQVEEWRFRTT